MRSFVALCGLIFVSTQAFAIINEVKAGKLGQAIRQSTVNLMYQPEVGKPMFKCSGVLVGRRLVLTAFHCVAPSENLWYGAPENSSRVIEFQRPGQRSRKYVGVKSIDYPKELKEFHQWGREFDRYMSDLSDGMKAKVTPEVRRQFILKYGGDVNMIADYTGEENEPYNKYLASLLSSFDSDKREQIYLSFYGAVEREMEKVIADGALQALDSFVKAHGFDGTYAQFENHVGQFDLALLTLKTDAPKEFVPVKIGTVDLREGSDQVAFAAGAGNFANFGDVDLNLTNSSMPVIRVGKVKITRRDGRSLVQRANPSRICRGDSGGPLYIEQKGEPILVGVHANVDYANEQEKNQMVKCLSDVDTRSIELMQFKDLLKPVLKK